jgi:membrane protein implicated in regulation of membrane protease activity
MGKLDKFLAVTLLIAAGVIGLFFSACGTGYIVLALNNPASGSVVDGVALGLAFLVFGVVTAAQGWKQFKREREKTKPTDESR